MAKGATPVDYPIWVWSPCQVELKPYVRSFEVFPPPSAESRLKLVTVSYDDRLALCFGKTTSETVIEKIFFRKIRQLGIPVKIKTNKNLGLWLIVRNAALESADVKNCPLCDFPIPDVNEGVSKTANIHRLLILMTKIIWERKIRPSFRLLLLLLVLW